MNSSFSGYAKNYDADFSLSEIGKLQRGRVWHFLKKNIPHRSFQILELNCGTGIDALWFAERDCSVLATDISAEMIKRAEVNTAARRELVQVGVCDCRNILSLTKGKQFDLIFSNFSGLNCLDETELKQLSDALSQLVKPGGKFIACFFGTKCIWERFYFLMKFNFKQMFRRGNGKSAVAKVGEDRITTWYYSVETIGRIFEKNFKVQKSMPVGFFIPPSYLNSIFKRIPFLLTLLAFFEKRFAPAMLSNYADHYIVSFTSS